MIGRLRRRMTALVLAALVLITSGIVLTINVLYWRNLENSAYEALQTLSLNGGKRPELPSNKPDNKLDGSRNTPPPKPSGEDRAPGNTGEHGSSPPPKPSGGPENGGGGERRGIQSQPGQPMGFSDAASLANSYTITLDADGGVTEWSSDRSDLYSDEQVADLAAAIYADGREYGHIGTQFFRVSKQEDGTALVVVLDQRLEVATAEQTLRTTLMVTLAALIALGLLAVTLIWRITKPVQEAFDRQKQFVSDASHELKTPLAVISANAEALSREIGDNEWLGYIRSEVDRSDRLVQNLLTLARMDRGGLMVKPKPVDLSKAVLSVTLPFESTVFEAGRTLETDVDEGVTCMGDEDLLKQLTVNLLSNALKYSDEGGRISVSLKNRGSRAVLRVWNTGETISPEDQEHIFDRFFRADASHSSERAGNGLGLAIARSIVEEHKGRIEVSSDPDTGTAFTVII